MDPEATGALIGIRFRPPDFETEDQIRPGFMRVADGAAHIAGSRCHLTAPLASSAPNANSLRENALGPTGHNLRYWRNVVLQ